MKKLLIGFLIAGSLSSFASNDCREVYASKIKKTLFQRAIDNDAHEGILAGGTFGTAIIGGYLNSYAVIPGLISAGAATSIALAPVAIYLGIEGTILLRNLPYSKAVKLINQSYDYRDSSQNKKTRLLKRISKKLNVSPEDLAETLIRGNEDMSLCESNLTKRSIVSALKEGRIKIIDVDESSDSGSETLFR